MTLENKSKFVTLFGGVNKAITLNSNELNHNFKCLGQNRNPGLMSVPFFRLTPNWLPLQKECKLYLARALSPWLSAIVTPIITCAELFLHTQYLTPLILNLLTHPLSLRQTPPFWNRKFLSPPAPISPPFLHYQIKKRRIVFYCATPGTFTCDF